MHKIKFSWAKTNNLKQTLDIKYRLSIWSYEKKFGVNIGRTKTLKVLENCLKWDGEARI